MGAVFRWTDRHAPEVLVLQIAAACSVADLDGHEVLTRLHKPGEADLSEQLGVLRIAGLVAIDPGGEAAPTCRITSWPLYPAGISKVRR
ncbi:hypothetical protein ASD79_21945 [Caulobacter sp. Root655]|nr:hypothetical protein ASD79_21945 [Caulobacter sp. Root655]